MDTNITIPKKEIAPGVFTTGGNATIPTNSPASVITPDSLKQQPRINLEGTLAQTQTGNDVVSGAITNATGFDADYQRMLQLQAQPKAESDVMSKLLQDITGAEQGLTGRGATQLSTEEQLGINELTRRRAETTQPRLKTAIAEYNALKTEFDQLKSDLEVGTRGSGQADIKLSMLVAQQGAVERQKLARLNAKASEIGLIEAEDLALKGQIDEAQKRADRAVDLLFADREAIYQTKLNQYNRIKDLLGEEDKKRGKALEYALSKEKEKIDAEKETAKTIEKMIIEATPNAPASVIANAKSIADRGGSAMDVSIALGQYGGDYLKSVLLKEQIATEKAQRSKIWEDINKIKAEAQKSTGLVYDPQATQKSITQLQFLKDKANQALNISSASGRSGLRRTAESWFVGSTKFTNLEALTNTLRTNVLTLMTDPEIKKFFGPQMSEADVRLMTAGGTTLNPELQSPESLAEEVTRLQDLFNRMENSIKQNSPEYQYIEQLTQNIDITGNSLVPSPSAYINSFNLEK